MVEKCFELRLLVRAMGGGWESEGCFAAEIFDLERKGKGGRGRIPVLFGCLFATGSSLLFGAATALQESPD